MNGKFKPRAFVSLVIVLSGLGLPVTGIVNHYYGFEPLSVARHAWMSAHNVLGLLFVAFGTWHVVLNRRALWGHLRGAAGHVRGRYREAVFAVVVVAAALLLFVGHAFHAGHAA